jgi:hypothetical protein
MINSQGDQSSAVIAHERVIAVGLLPLLTGALQVLVPTAMQAPTQIGSSVLVWVGLPLGLLLVLGLATAPRVTGICAMTTLGAVAGSQLEPLTGLLLLAATACTGGLCINAVARFSAELEGEFSGDPIALVASVATGVLLSGLICGALLFVFAPWQVSVCNDALVTVAGSAGSVWAVPLTYLLLAGLLGGLGVSTTALSTGDAGCAAVLGAGLGLALGGAPAWGAQVAAWLGGGGVERIGLLVCAGASNLATTVSILGCTLTAILGFTLIACRAAEGNLRHSLGALESVYLPRLAFGHIVVTGVIAWLWLG